MFYQFFVFGVSYAFVVLGFLVPFVVLFLVGFGFFSIVRKSVKVEKQVLDDQEVY